MTSTKLPDLASFSALSSGDMDFNMNIWQLVTHEEYLEEYGDDLEEVGVWNSDANQVIAVNEDALIDSLDELAITQTFSTASSLH